MLEEFIENIERRLGTSLTDQQIKIAEELIKRGNDSETIASQFRNEITSFYI